MSNETVVGGAYPAAGAGWRRSAPPAARRSADDRDPYTIQTPGTGVFEREQLAGEGRPDPAS